MVPLERVSAKGNHGFSFITNKGQSCLSDLYHDHLPSGIQAETRVVYEIAWGKEVAAVHCQAQNKRSKARLPGVKSPHSVEVKGSCFLCGSFQS